MRFGGVRIGRRHAAERRRFPRLLPADQVVRHGKGLEPAPHRRSLAIDNIVVFRLRGLPASGPIGPATHFGDQHGLHLGRFPLAALGLRRLANLRQ